MPQLVKLTVLGSSSSTLEVNSALSPSNHNFTHSQTEELHGYTNMSSPTMSSATPDSTRSPLSLAANSPTYSVTSMSLLDSSEIVRNEFSCPRQDLRSSRQWCEDCSKFYDKECPQHRIQLIFDKPILNRAWASLPATHLSVTKIAIDEKGDPVYGVFAKKTIPKRTQFGPIEGVLMREDPPSNNFILLIEDDEGMALYLDTSDESKSNWMRFVRPADTHEEQNLVLFQHGHSLYFNVRKSIDPKTELRVWYSPAYAEKWGLPLLEPTGQQIKAIQKLEASWPCFECNQHFATSVDLQKHLNQHKGNDVSDKPQTSKKRRAKSKLARKGLQCLRGENLNKNAEISLTRKARGRPRKKYKGENLNENAEISLVRKSRGRPRKKDKENLNENAEISLVRKARGRPPKKYTDFVTDENLNESAEISLIRNTRGRPKNYQLLSKQGLKCEICNKIFPSHYSLQRHSMTHSGEKNYKCSICDIKFRYIYNRNRHVQRHIKKGETASSFKSSLLKQEAEWMCTHCDLTFGDSNVLNLHVLTHTAADVAFNEEHQILEDSTIYNVEGLDNKLVNENVHKCPECTHEFTSQSDLIKHVSVHAKIGNQRHFKKIKKPFKCNVCYKSFASDESLSTHQLVHGSEDSKPLQCDICNKRFLNNAALACHVKVHSEEKKCYECPICKTEFDQVFALKEHVHVHRENGVYNCPSCPKVFEEYHQIRKHIRGYHSEQKYPCDKCEKVFPRTDKLKLHMICHSDNWDFLCSHCGKQFKRKDKLNEHIKRMHAPGFLCSSCGETFKKKEKLIKHMEKWHGPNSDNKVYYSRPKKFVPEVAPTDYHRFIYKCHTCLLGFKKRGMLVNHLAKKHPDIRPESVPELNVPIMKTTRDYYCQYCEKVYKSSSKRKAHILKNHPGSELPLSCRWKGELPELSDIPNPTYSETVGIVTTDPHQCNWCHKQYAFKEKLLQHQRIKHNLDLLTLSNVANNTMVDTEPDDLSTAVFEITYNLVETICLNGDGFHTRSTQLD